MKTGWKRGLVLAPVALLLVAGCTQLGMDDRTLLTQTKAAAEAAQRDAAAARAAAERAAAESKASADASKAAAADAKAANERVERMYQSSLRK